MELLAFGTTHVAVGFVDLGALSAYRIEQDVMPGPLRWVGYEASPYAVAKTLVVAQMLRSGAPVDDIVQVCVWPACGFVTYY